MFRICILTPVLIVSAMLLCFWVSIIAAAEKPLAISDNILPETDKTRIEKRSRAADIKTLADLAIDKMVVCPGFSAGPAIQVTIKNKGPMTAIKPIQPEHRGLEECRTYNNVAAGSTGYGGGYFIVEGAMKATTSVTPDKKRRREN